MNQIKIINFYIFIEFDDFFGTNNCGSIGIISKVSTYDEAKRALEYQY